MKDFSVGVGVRYGTLYGVCRGTRYGVRYFCHPERNRLRYGSALRCMSRCLSRNALRCTLLLSSCRDPSTLRRVLLNLPLVEWTNPYRMTKVAYTVECSATYTETCSTTHSAETNAAIFSTLPPHSPHIHDKTQKYTRPGKAIRILRRCACSPSAFCAAAACLESPGALHERRHRILYEYCRQCTGR